MTYFDSQIHVATIQGNCLQVLQNIMKSPVITFAMPHIFWLTSFEIQFTNWSIFDKTII